MISTENATLYRQPPRFNIGKTTHVKPMSPAKVRDIHFSGQPSSQTPWQKIRAFLGAAAVLMASLRLMFPWMKNWWNGKTSVTNQIVPTASPLNENLPMGKLTAPQLFGPDPKQITFEQQGGNSCYLLSALDNIFQHPQSLKILDKIGFEKTAQGYMVRFPGQAQPVQVRKHEIRSNGVRSDNFGVRLLEAAYFKIPDREIRWGQFDNTKKALVRMFGNSIVPSEQAALDDISISQSFELASIGFDAHADVWTATHRVKDANDQPIATGEHYYSVRSVPDNPRLVNLIDPFNTAQIVETLTIRQLNKKYQTEMNRIQLEDAVH